MVTDSPIIYYHGVPIYITDYCFYDPERDQPGWFSASPCRNDMVENIHAHLHGEIEIHLMLRGRMIVTLEDHEIILMPGDMLIVNPFELHHGMIPTGEIAEYIHTVFDLNSFGAACGKAADELCRQLFLGERCFINHIPSGTADISGITGIMRRMLGIYELFGEKPIYSDCALTGAVCELLGCLLEQFPPAEKSAHNKRRSEFRRSVKSFIDGHYAEDITTETTARALGYNKNYFCTLFKENFGMSFSHYLCEYRIEISKEYKGQELSLTDIATRCGFPSYGYYTRCFKQHLGVTPSNYFHSK